jgi:hypothetical protein
MLFKLVHALSASVARNCIRHTAPSGRDDGALVESWPEGIPFPGGQGQQGAEGCASLVPLELIVRPPACASASGCTRRPRRGIPGRVTHVQPHKAMQEQVVIELFRDKPLAARGIEDLQQPHPQQVLRGSRGATGVRIKQVGLGRQLIVYSIGHRTRRRSGCSWKTAHPAKCC